MSSSELSTLASRIRLTFDAARANAETTGMDHVPDESRQAVERAAKAARLSTASKSRPERTAALEQAMRILESLRLYYMPTRAEAEAITGGKQVLALPGRRREDGETSDAS